MSIPSQTDPNRRSMYRGGWLIAILAMLSYVLIAFAEQGSAGASLQMVPQDPLPFDRHQSAGIDLSQYTSLQALEWLEQADVSSVSMVLVPIDGDIVGAFNNPDSFTAARVAVDQLLDAADGTPVTACLNRPISAIEESILAEAAVTALVENYTDRLAYIGACARDSSPAWQSGVLNVLGHSHPDSTTTRLLAPVSLGAPIRLLNPVLLDDVTSEYLDSVSGTSYAALRISRTPELNESDRSMLQNTLHDRAHIASVIVAPDAGFDPAGFVASLDLDFGDFRELSEGFNNVGAQQIEWFGDWTLTEVGPVAYQRTTETGSWFTAEFIGTELWALGIASPDGGRLGVWIDASTTQATGSPDRIVSLTRTQARDASVLLIDGLPAARHTITVVAADGEVAISGVFVTGRPVAGWHGLTGAFGMIAVAIAGLGIVLVATVDDLRSRIGLDRTGEEDDLHPRVFRRDD
jgi:hypothetical protein